MDWRRCSWALIIIFFEIQLSHQFCGTALLCSGALSGCYKCHRLFWGHRRKITETSDHFESLKDNIFNTCMLNYVTLDLKNVDTNIFITDKKKKNEIIRPINDNTIISAIKFGPDELKLHPTPLYREIHKFNSSTHIYFYIMSYYGEEYIYYQIYRKKHNFRRESKCKLVEEDSLPEELTDSSVLTNLSTIVTGNETEIQVFDNLISKNVGRVGTRENFSLFSIIPNEKESSVLKNIAKNRTNQVLNLNGRIKKTLPTNYDYFVLFTKDNVITLIISNNNSIERLKYFITNNSIIQYMAINQLEQCSTQRFSCLNEEHEFHPVELDLTTNTFLPSLIYNFQDDEVKITSKPGKVITKVKLFDFEIDLDPNFPANYVKIQKFLQVSIVFISGFSNNKPYSKYFLINNDQMSTHEIYPSYFSTELSYQQKGPDYNKSPTSISVGIHFFNDVFVFENTPLINGTVSSNIHFFTCMGKIDTFKVNNFSIKPPEASVANYFMYFISEPSILALFTIDDNGKNSFQLFYHLISGDSSHFRAVPPNKSEQLISQLFPQYLSSFKEEFNNELLIDLEKGKASPGIQITYLQDNSTLYTIDKSFFGEDKKSYISSIKIGSYYYQIKPGWAQVATCNRDNHEILIIIDEIGDNEMEVSRTVFSIPKVTIKTILLTSTSFDWNNPIQINKIKLPLPNLYNAPPDYRESHVLNLSISDPKGIPGVFIKMDFDNNNTIYVPAIDSGVIIGDVLHAGFKDPWRSDYIFTVVQHTKNNNNSSSYNIYRLEADKTTLSTFIIDNDGKCVKNGPKTFSKKTNNNYEPALVDLDFNNPDNRYFETVSKEQLKTIETLKTDDSSFNGSKYKIGKVLISQNVKDRGYPRYSDKRIEYNDDKINIQTLVDNKWYSEIYEKTNGEFKFKSQDSCEDILSLDNLRPWRGMQYVTLEDNVTLIKLTGPFLYCGEKITISSSYAYALLIKNRSGDGNLGTSLWLYEVSSDRYSKGTLYQCTKVPFTDPQFNTIWVDSTHTLAREMNERMIQKNYIYPSISTLNLDSNSIPDGIIKAQYGSMTVYTSLNKSIGNIVFGNVSLTVNSAFTRVFFQTLNHGRYVLVESYTMDTMQLKLYAFKEMNPCCYSRIGIDKLVGQLKQLVKPYELGLKGPK